MARGVNKVILIGNLGNDPEIRYTPNGSAVANLSLATTEVWRDKQSGDLQERTEWHRVVFFNRLAEIVGEHLKKGSKIYVEGTLRTRKWQGRDGVDRYTTEIIASEMHMLDRRSGGFTDGAYSSNNVSTSTPQETVTASPVAEKGTNVPNVAETADDDIPF